MVNLAATPAYRRPRLIAAVGAVALTLATLGTAASPASAASGDMTEFPLLAGSGPWGVASGADGNIWVTDASNSMISRLSTAGALTTFVLPTPGSAPRDIALGPDNNLWFTEGGSSKIGMITPAGAITEWATLSPGAEPWGIAAGPDGALWFTERLGNRIGRITTAGAMTEFPLPTAASQPLAIIAGPQGSNLMYFTQLAGNRIGIVTMAGGVSNTVTLPAGSAPAGMTLLNGGVWFVESGTSNLARLVNDSTVARISLPGAGPVDVEAGPGNTLWVSATAMSQVWKLSDQGVVLGQYPTTTPGAAPVNIAPGSDGNMWVALNAVDKVARVVSGQVPTSSAAPAITPATGAVPGTVLSTSNGTWALASSFTYQWQSCTSGSTGCTDIPGATAATYTAAATDNQKFVRAGVVGVNLSGPGAIAYSAAVSVGTVTPPTPPTPPPATGTMASIGNGATAELLAPTSQKRGKSKSYSVIFTATDVSGTVTFTFTAKGKKKTVSVPVTSTGAKYSWKTPKSWKKGKTTVKAAFVPAVGSPYSGGNMIDTVKIT